MPAMAIRSTITLLAIVVVLSYQSGTAIFVKTRFEYPITISENGVDYTPTQLFTIDYKLISKEHTVCDGKSL
jgi:hypothetical protein